MKNSASNHWISLKLKMGVLLCALVFSVTQVFASSYVQNTKISLELKQQSIEDVFEAIKNQTEFKFFYNDTQLDVKRKVSVDVENETINKVLDQILEGTNCTYEIYRKQIIIKEVPKVIEQQEKIKLKGTVTDDKGEPIPFASVCFKGTTNGCVAALDGKFELEMNADPSANLVVSCIGFETVEVPIGSKREFTIQLKSATEGLEEIVVTGYQVISKERTSGSFEKVNAEELDAKIARNLTDKLEGLSSGVRVNADGDILIRGIGSFNANTQPLVVLNGYPIQGDINDINPNDIEDVTILKDAAAASIWGARASNGVIVIRTKSGTSEKPTIKASVTHSIQQAYDLDDFQFGSSSDLVDLQLSLKEGGFISVSPGDIQPSYNPVVDLILNYNDTNYSAEDLAKINAYRNKNVDREFEKRFLQSKKRTQYNVAISGKGEKNDYYASIGYDDLKGFEKDNDDAKLNAFIKSGFDISDKLKLNLSVYSVYQKQKLNGVGLNDYQNTFQYESFLDANGNSIYTPRGIHDADKARLASEGYPYHWGYNLLDEKNNRNNKIVTTNNRFNLGLDFTIIDGLKLSSGVVYEYSNTNERNLYNENTYYTRNLVNDFTYNNGSELVSPIPEGSILHESNFRSSAFTFRNQLNFDKQLGENHRLIALAGVEVREEKNKGNVFGVYGYNNQSLNFQGVDYSSLFYRVSSPTSDEKLPNPTRFVDVKDRFFSYFSNVSYGYKNRYILTASIRSDDSNLFGASNKYRNVPLWSIGANWKLSQEAWFDFNFVDKLNLRATYGFNGNVDKTTSPQLIASLKKDSRYNIDYANIENPQNPDLRWEKTAVTNIGMDFSMFSNRLSGSVDYYNKLSTDLLANVTVNSTLGFNTARLNNGEMLNRGVDIQLNANLIDRAVKWNLNVNYGYNHNEVKKADVTDNTIAGYLSGALVVGNPLNSMYSYKWAGVSDVGEPQIYDENNNVIGPDMVITNPDALKYEGSKIPTHYGSLINQLSYKNFSLSAMLTYSLGFKFREPTVDYLFPFNGAGVAAHVHKDYANRWTSSNMETNVPGNPLSTSTIRIHNEYNQNASKQIKDGSNIRFKEVVLNYRLSDKLLKGTLFKSVILGVQAKNIFTFTFADTDYDPEYTYNHFNYVLPPGFELSFSLKATF